MDEILINTTTAGIQNQPAIARFLGSHFMVVWRDASDGEIKCQRFAAEGNRVGGEVVVNEPTPTPTNTNRHLPAITACGGGLAAAWIENAFNPPGPRPHVKAQRFDRDGQKIGPEFQVSTMDVDPAHRPALAGLIDGGFVVTWVDARSDNRIRAQRFTLEGSKNGPEFRVNTTEGFHEKPIVTSLENGNFVIGWTNDPAAPGGGGLRFQIFDLEGSPVGGETAPNLFGGQAITLLDNGRFVIATFREGGIGVVERNVKADVFEADGVRSDISVFASDEHPIQCSWPALAPLPGGRFVLAWAQKRADSSDPDTTIKAKIFSDSQGSVGQDVQINTTTGSARFGVCIATVFGGEAGEHVFIAWADDSRTGGDTSDFAVRGRALPILPSGGLG